MKAYEALKLKYLAKIKEVEHDLEVYINQPVGVGEHSDILKEIDKKIRQLADYTGYLQTLDTTFLPVVDASSEEGGDENEG